MVWTSICCVAGQSLRAGLPPLLWEAEEPREQRYSSLGWSAQHKKPNFEGIQVNLSLFPHL